MCMYFVLLTSVLLLVEICLVQPIMPYIVHVGPRITWSSINSLCPVNDLSLHSLCSLISVFDFIFTLLSLTSQMLSYVIFRCMLNTGNVEHSKSITKLLINKTGKASDLNTSHNKGWLSRFSLKCANELKDPIWVTQAAK